MQETEAKQPHAMPEWLRQAATIIAAAVSAYLGIRVDVATLTAQMASVQAEVARHERAIERLNEQRAK
jgi:cell division protein FtsB